MTVCILNIANSHSYFANQLDTIILTISSCRCTLNPSDQVALEGPLSRVKSIKKSLRQSFRRIRRSRVSMHKHHTNNAAKVAFSCLLSLSDVSAPQTLFDLWSHIWSHFIPELLCISWYIFTNQLQELNARLEAEALHEMELAPVQRKIEARSADDSFTGLVRTLCFADTFLSDSKWDNHEDKILLFLLITV